MKDFKRFSKTKHKLLKKNKLKFPYSFDDVFFEQQLLSGSNKFINTRSDTSTTLVYFIVTLLLFALFSNILSSLHYALTTDYLDLVGDILITSNTNTNISGIVNQVDYYNSPLFPKNLKVFAFLNLLS